MPNQNKVKWERDIILIGQGAMHSTIESNISIKQVTNETTLI